MYFSHGTVCPTCHSNSQATCRAFLAFRSIALPRNRLLIINMITL